VNQRLNALLAWNKMKDRKIYVDADACPVPIKEMLYRAADRAEIEINFVANHSLRLPNSKYLTFTQVEKGFDIADNHIVMKVNERDLVITSDIPLADEVITKGAIALNPRGELYTKANIKSLLNMRDFMDTMRSSGVEMKGGPAPLNQQDKQQFANQLDKWLVKG